MDLELVSHHSGDLSFQLDIEGSTALGLYQIGSPQAPDDYLQVGCRAEVAVGYIFDIVMSNFNLVMLEREMTAKIPTKVTEEALVFVELSVLAGVGNCPESIDFDPDGEEEPVKDDNTEHSPP